MNKLMLIVNGMCGIATGICIYSVSRACIFILKKKRKSQQSKGTIINFMNSGEKEDEVIFRKNYCEDKIFCKEEYNLNKISQVDEWNKANYIKVKC